MKAFKRGDFVKVPGEIHPALVLVPENEHGFLAVLIWSGAGWFRTAQWLAGKGRRCDAPPEFQEALLALGLTLVAE